MFGQDASCFPSAWLQQSYIKASKILSLALSVQQ